MSLLVESHRPSQRYSYSNKAVISCSNQYLQVNTVMNQTSYSDTAIFHTTGLRHKVERKELLRKPITPYLLANGRHRSEGHLRGGIGAGIDLWSLPWGGGCVAEAQRGAGARPGGRSRRRGATLSPALKPEAPPALLSGTHWSQHPGAGLSRHRAPGWSLGRLRLLGWS